MKFEKLTFEMRKAIADKLRRHRARLRERHDLPVTQQMIIEYLIDKADTEELKAHFEQLLSSRLGATEAELKKKRRAAYEKSKKAR